MLRRWLLAALLLCLPFAMAQADEPTVEAVLETSVALPGEPVQLEIAVSGTRSASAPDIKVDGLDVEYRGPQQMVQMNNFEVSQSIVHHYEIIPRRVGEFTIPALEVKVKGQTLKTRPLKLTVNRSGTLSGGSGEEAEGEGADEIFMEWVVPKETLYIGEVIPVELRLFVRDDVPFQLKELPKVKTDGLTLREFPREPKAGRVQRGGATYKVIVFKSALSAVKVGELKLESTGMTVMKAVPERRPSRRQRVPRGFPDVFNDPFFNAPFQQTVVRPFPVQAPDVTLTVKPLPTEGRPASFSGAVGRFELTTKASPVKGRAGDPITVKSVVTGSGNFQRMEAPPIAAEDGWQVYPPTSRFEADDDVEISGKKTFEQAVIPDGPATELPPISFSYFDPVAEKYVVLKGDTIPLEITGSAPKPTPAPSVPNTAAATPSATPAARAAEPNDILFIRTDGPGVTGSFAPVWRGALFPAAQLIPLGALLMGGLLYWKRRRAADGVLQRRVALREKKQGAQRALRDESLPAAAFYEAAVTAFTHTAALQRDDLSLPDSAEAVCRGREFDAETRQAITAAFDGLNEIRYAGATKATVSAPRRAAVLKALEQLETHHAR